MHFLKPGISCSAILITWLSLFRLSSDLPRAAQPQTTTPIVRAGLEEVISDLPELGKDVIKLYLHPRRFVVHWKELPISHASTKEAVGWSLAFAGLLLTLYKRFFGASCFAKLSGTAKSLKSTKIGAKPQNETSKPKFLRLAVLEKLQTVSYESSGKMTYRGSEWSIGLGIDFPQSSDKNVDEPQIVAFKIGVATIYFGDVIPSSFDSKVPQLFFLILLSMIIAVCVHPFAKLLGGTARFVQVFQITCLLFSFSLVLFSMALVFVTVLFADILKLRPVALQMAYLGTVLVPGSLLLSRAYFGSYSELYHLSYLRLTIASLGGVGGGCVSSYVLAPMVILPLIYLLLRFQEFWEAIL